MQSARFPIWLRRFLPDPFTHIPSEAEMERNEARITKGIVMAHAEGSVLLGEGKFTITRDLLADEEPGADEK